MNQEMKLAVLIDAENISSKYIDVILSEANNLGDVIYKRIYGNWTTPQMASWRNTILDNAIQPVQQYSNTIRKNSSDSALIIDTMDLLYQSNLDGFCIVSSDSDFTRLASRLRESQKYVLGMGESKTPRSFISACNKFLYLDVLWEEAEEHEAGDHEGTDHEEAQAEHTSPQAKAEKPEADNHASETPAARPLTPPETMPLHGKTPGKDFSTIRQALIKLTEENSDDNGWIFSGTLGNLLSKQFSDFDVRNFGYKKFVPFIESLKLFDVNTFTDEKNRTVKHNYFKLKQTPSGRGARSAPTINSEAVKTTRFTEDTRHGCEYTKGAGIAAPAKGQFVHRHRSGPGQRQLKQYLPPSAGLDQRRQCPRHFLFHQAPGRPGPGTQPDGSHAGRQQAFRCRLG